MGLRSGICILLDANSERIVLDSIVGKRYSRISTMKLDADNSPPLSPATLHILLALSGGDLHGYGIIQEVARHSEGRYKLGPGTLYDNLQRLMKQGLVEEAGGGDDNPRRRYYRLSSIGRRVLSAEIARLDGVVKEARVRRVPQPGRAARRMSSEDRRARIRMGLGCGKENVASQEDIWASTGGTHRLSQSGHPVAWVRQKRQRPRQSRGR